MCIIIGKEKHTCCRKILKYKDYTRMDLVKRFVALEALMSTKYRFTTVPKGLRRKSSSYEMHQPQMIGEIKLSKPKKQVSTTTNDTTSRMVLSKNGQYKIDILDPKYKNHLYDWVWRLALQNQVNGKMVFVLYFIDF